MVDAKHRTIREWNSFLENDSFFLENVNDETNKVLM